MLTVLIAEQNHIDAIQKENSMFFEPFLDRRDLTFCAWNPEGQTLKESVPGLQDAVGRCREWRAMIIHSCSDEQKKKVNPYDEVDCSAISEIKKPNAQPDGKWEEWVDSWKEYYGRLSEAKKTVFEKASQQPLTRLSTWLCFSPADFVFEDVAEKLDAEDWAMDALGEEGKKPSAHLETMERDQYRLELRMKESIRRDFIKEQSINIARPKELFCISERITETGFFDPEPYWNIHPASDYSEFADRNMLYDKMRFMVFDLLPKAHRNFRSDYIRFLYAVLVFASNPTPASAMQSRKLYQLDLESDETPLCIMATSYEKKLTSTLEVIENEIDKIRSEIPGELTDKEAASLFLVPADVPVTLDASCDPDAVEVDRDYGLATDCPEDEQRKWASDYLRAEKEMAYIIKQQERSVKKSIEKLDNLSEINGANVSRLTSFQMDDIREFTEAAEDEIIKTAPPDCSKSQEYIDSMKEQSAEIKDIIRSRMSKKITIAIGAVCLGLYLICFLPLIFSNNASEKTLLPAVILTISMLVFMAIVMIISLLVLRRPLVGAVTEFNEDNTAALNRIKDDLQSYSGYLSSVCNVRRGYAVLDHCQNNPDEFTKSIRIRKKHQEDIKKKRAFLIEGYGDYIADKRFYDETMIQPYEYDFNMKTEYDYPAPFLAGDFRQVPFLESGNLVAVPSSYVRRITLKMEEIYDR